jgi:hypothetical protein
MGAFEPFSLQHPFFQVQLDSKEDLSSEYGRLARDADNKKEDVKDSTWIDWIR